MNIKNNIGLILKVGISLVFAGYVGVEVYKSMDEEGVKVTKSRFFMTLAEDVTMIQLLAGTTQVRLKKGNTQWFIEEPIKEKANQDLIEDWLEALRDSSTEAVPEELATYELTKFGLHDPLAKINFLKTDGQSYEVAVSATKTFNGQNYLSYSDTKVKNKVLTSNLAWFDFILKKPIDFLSTEQVMSFDSEILSKIEIKNLNPQPATEVNAFQALTSGVFVKDKDLWAFKAKVDGDGAKAMSLVSLLKSAVVYSFEADTVAFKNNKDVKPIFEMDFHFVDKTKDKIVVYNYFRPCLPADPKKNCQLVVMSSKPYPLWVEPQDMTTILNLGFLKK